MLPLFGAMPGGPEMLIILLVLLVLFFGPVVAVVYLLLRQSGDASGVDDDQMAEMQARIDELEAELTDDHAAESRQSDHTHKATDDEKSG